MYPAIEVIKAALLEAHYLSPEDSKAAEAAAHDSGEYINYLITHELLTTNLLGQALAESCKLTYADLEAHPVSKEQIAKVPEDAAREQRIVFLRANDKAVLVATDQPDKLDAKVLAGLFGGKRVVVSYALPTAIDASLQLYERSLPTRFTSIIAAGKRVAPEIVDEIIKEALRYKASDIHFEPARENAMVRFRVDGSLHEAGAIDKPIYENLLNHIKVESGMRIDEHFTAQDGSMRYDGTGQAADLRVSLIPTVQGEKVVMRVLGSYVQSFSLSDIGLSEAQQAELQEHASKPFGMILTVGPTGSGKTTTLYALLKLLNRSDVNITTIEDPVEYQLAGINQIQVAEQANMTFGRGLRAIVRQDPDVIFVGEIRDQETAEISVNAALTGHLLLSTFHANDAATAIPRLLDIGIEPFLLASTLEVVIAQRLARKLCSHCRYSVQVEEALKNVANRAALAPYFDHVENLYAAKGCANCNNTSYQGRVAIFEYIPMTPELQDLLQKTPSARDIAALARKQGATTMFEDGVAKVKTGATTIQEVLRVVGLPTGVHSG